MPTYRSVRKPVRSDWTSPEFAALCQPDTLTVHEDNEPVDTGLLDEHGNSIYRLRDRVPVGYRA